MTIRPFVPTLVALLFAMMPVPQGADNETSAGNKHVRIVHVEAVKDGAAVTVQVTPFDKDQWLCVHVFQMQEGRVQYDHEDPSMAAHCGSLDAGGADGSEAHPAVKETWESLEPGTYLAAAFLTRINEDGPAELPSNKVAFEVDAPAPEPPTKRGTPGGQLVRHMEARDGRR